MGTEGRPPLAVGARPARASNASPTCSLGDLGPGRDAWKTGGPSRVPSIAQRPRAVLSAIRPGLPGPPAAARPAHMRHARRRCAAGLEALPLAQRIELAIGPSGVSAFAGEDERRRAWERHRAELLALEPPGRRPWAWWFYEQTG